MSNSATVDLSALEQQIQEYYAELDKETKGQKMTANTPHSNVFFVGDPHFGHKMMVRERVINGVTHPPLRPFDSVDEMNHTLITNWNKTIPSRGLVYVLGDVSFASHGETVEILQQLNGHKHLIIGNHDEKRITKHPYTEMFRWMKHYARIKVPDVTAPDGKSRRIVLCHYPFMTWHGSYRGTWHLHGHCHGNLPDNRDNFRIDVGVDCHDFKPIDFERVCELMKGRVFKPVDHHGEYIEE